jgi:hypothetical protein
MMLFLLFSTIDVAVSDFFHHCAPSALASASSHPDAGSISSNAENILGVV